MGDELGGVPVHRLTRFHLYLVGRGAGSPEAGAHRRDTEPITASTAEVTVTGVHRARVDVHPGRLVAEGGRALRESRQL